MTTKEALQAMAVEARGKADYFRQRAGRREESDRGVVIPLAEPHERAKAERRALAFLGAAAVIKQVAEKGTWP